MRFVPLVALLLLSAGSCAMGRNNSGYRSFVGSHDAIRPGMSLSQVFDAGLADYLIQSGGKNVPGSTMSEKEPVSADCRRHVLDVHYGTGFDIRVYCNMNGPADKQVTPERAFQTKADLLRGLDVYSSWAKSMRFRVESQPLQIGGVYDSYDFSTDEGGKVSTVSPIVKASK